jgi:hypothetical protein
MKYPCSLCSFRANIRETLAATGVVSIQLVDTHLRQIVLSKKHDFNPRDVFEIQDEIAKQVAKSLRHRFYKGAAARHILLIDNC